MGCLLYAPSELWPSQVAKRTAAFALASAVAATSDWLYLTDGDELVTDLPADLHARLDRTRFDVAEVTSYTRPDVQATQATAELHRRLDLPREPGTPHRALIRNLPGLRCEGAHYLYLAEREGRTIRLRGPSAEPALDLRDLRVEHRHHLRDRERCRQAREFKQLRRELQLEREPVRR
jgi:hypothetical protein